MNKSNKEIFTLVILNRKKEIIHEESLYLGSELHIDCQPIEIVKKVIKHNVLMLDHIIVGDDGYYSYQETSGYNPSNY